MRTRIIISQILGHIDNVKLKVMKLEIDRRKYSHFIIH